MAQPTRRKPQPTAIVIAEDLHKHHTHAEAAFLNNPSEIVFTEADVIKLLVKYGHPEPDFEGYAKISTDSPSGYMSQKKELLRLVGIIKEGMRKKGINNAQLAKLLNVGPSTITSLLSGRNMTAATMLKLERVLDIKLLNH